MTQTVTVVGPQAALDPDEVVLVLDDRDWVGWSTVRITRGIERIPNDFEFTLTELYPGEAELLVVHAGSKCEIFIGRDLVLSGYVDRVMPRIGPRIHEVTISGRGKCQDLVDCAAEWEGSVITADTVLGVASKLSSKFGITVSGTPGPAVGNARISNIIPFVRFYLGETPWEIIDRLCRIAGLLPYELPDGNLWIAANPGDIPAGGNLRRGSAVYAAPGYIPGPADAPTSAVNAASGFSEGVNVKHASATYAADQRFSVYRVYRYSMQPQRDVTTGAVNQITEYHDTAVRYRPMVIIAEMDKQFGVANASDRGAWEASRRYGRAHMVSLTTDSWRDAAGNLYAPNTLVPLELPSLKASGKTWLIGQVTYRKSENGTECDLVIMPPEAFSVQPTLPVNTLPPDLISQ